MDLTFILSAVIFTLLAIVVATSLFAKSYIGSSRGTKAKGGLDRPAVHSPAAGKKKQAVEDCTALSTARSKDDPKMSEESHADPHTEELGTATVEQSTATVEQSTATVEQSTTTVEQSTTTVEQSTTTVEQSTSTVEQSTSTVEQSTTTLSGHEPASSLDVDSPESEASSGRGHRSYIGLSDTELLKCAFSHSQADGPPESLGILEDTEFKYTPGAVRTQEMQSMMSKDELEEERRVQREQLAAIFQLLKDNQETFGEVNEGDMEQQLKLYSI